VAAEFGWLGGRLAPVGQQRLDRHLRLSRNPQRQPQTWHALAVHDAGDVGLRQPEASGEIGLRLPGQFKVVAKIPFRHGRDEIMHVLHESQQELCGPCIVDGLATSQPYGSADTFRMRNRHAAVRYRLIDALGQLSQTEIADALGINQSTMSRLLNPSGTTRLTVDFLLRFAEQVGADPAYLLTGRPSTAEAQLPSSHNADTVGRSTQREHELLLRNEETGLLQSLTGHFSAIRAIYRIAEAVRDYPDQERAIASAVEHAVDAATRARAAHPKR
jgi:transcriptional regulator with XRE-family HTH domain